MKAVCSSAIEKDFDPNLCVEEYYCNTDLPFYKYMAETYLYDETTVVRPKYWNQRIANQGGVFMVFPNNTHDIYRTAAIKCKELGIEKAIAEYGLGQFDSDRFRNVLNCEPVSIYKKEPRYLTERCFRKMSQAYSSLSVEEMWSHMSRRFFLSDSIKTLSKKKLERSFCSIIIDHNSKKRILHDLSSIGFGVDYIYPDLEYTAEQIKRQFGL